MGIYFRISVAEPVERQPFAVAGAEGFLPGPVYRYVNLYF
jgi:hypothetical protein